MDFTYDMGLVALSIAVVILGSFTALVMTAGIGVRRGQEAWSRVALGTTGFGAGIWAMHFIGLLAIKLPIPIGYDISRSISAGGLAVGTVFAALLVAAFRPLRDRSIIAAAGIMGLGIAAMQYVGISGIRCACSTTYTALSVVLTILIGVQAAGGALWLAFSRRGLTTTAAGAIGLGLGIAAMHYSAMETLRFLPAAWPGPAVIITSQTTLALTIAIVVYALCAMCLVLFALMTFRRRSTSG